MKYNSRFQLGWEFSRAFFILKGFRGLRENITLKGLNCEPTKKDSYIQRSGDFYEFITQV